MVALLLFILYPAFAPICAAIAGRRISATVRAIKESTTLRIPAALVEYGLYQK
jgi:hypothetical protein